MKEKLHIHKPKRRIEADYVMRNPDRCEAPDSDQKLLFMHAKITRPAISERSIFRPRLVERLKASLDKRITIISAAAGFGKTTLAAQLLDQCPSQSAWVSLESNESEPEYFLRYVIAAIRKVVPNFGAQTNSLLSAVNLPPPLYLADAMTSELNCLTQPLVLVFDDYHFIQSQETHQMVQKMISHLPDRVHLVFLTRKDPPWPLTRWRSQAWVNELGSVDLQFSLEETGLFFKDVDFTTETVATLHKQSEGWIAGLQLMKVSLDNAGYPSRLNRSGMKNYRLIVGYLMEEVIQHQSREILDFLSVTALFDRFCASLCDHVLVDLIDRQQSKKRIDQLEEKNLFLVPLDRERIWYRYHHLFRDLLTSYLINLMEPKRIAILNRRAGKWFADQGLIEDAIKYYLRAGDVNAAAALLEENLHTIIDTDLSRRRLKRLLGLLPPQAEINRPALLIAHAYVQLFNWNIPVVKKLHAQVESLLQDAGNTITEARRLSIQSDLEAQKGFCHYWLGEIDEAIQSACRALKLVPDEHRLAYSLAIMYAAGGYAASGRKEKGLRLLSEVEAKSWLGLQFAGPIGLARMAIYSYAGNLGDVIEVSKLMLSLKKGDLPDFFRGYAYFFQGLASYEQNRLTVAKEFFEKAVAMKSFLQPALYHDCLIGLTLVQLAMGNPAAARKHIDKALEFARESNDSYSIAISQALSMRLQIQLGESPFITMEPPNMFEGNRIWLLSPMLIRAENVVLLGKPEDCHTVFPLLDAAIEQAEKIHNVRQVIQFLAVKAVALKCAGRKEKALHVLEKTLKMAKPLGFIRTFLDRGPHMAGLLQKLSEKKPQDSYLRDLVSAFSAQVALKVPGVLEHADPYGEMPQDQSADICQTELSNRELDVLLLLEQRFSNQEIADQLCISIHTVKKHTSNIFKKLAVNKRSQAVTKARKHGLLPPR